MSEDARRAEQAERQVAELQAQLRLQQQQQQRGHAVAPYVDRASQALRLLKESHMKELTRMKRQYALLDATHRSETADLRARVETVRAERAAMRQALLQSETARKELEAELHELQAAQRSYGQTDTHGASDGGTSVGHELPPVALQEVARSVRRFVVEKYGEAALQAFGPDLAALLTVKGPAPRGYPDHAAPCTDSPEAAQTGTRLAQIDPERAPTGMRVAPTDHRPNTAEQVSAASVPLRIEEAATQDEESDTEEDGSGTPHDGLEEMPLSQMRQQIDEAIGSADHVFVLRTLIDAKQSAEVNTLGACLEALTSYATTFKSSNGTVSSQIERLSRKLDKVEFEQSASQRAMMEVSIKAMDVDITHLKALLAAGLLADKSKLSELEQRHRAAVYKVHRQESPTGDDDASANPLQLDPRIKTHAIGDTTAELWSKPVPSSARGTGVFRRFSISQSPRAAGGSSRQADLAAPSRQHTSSSMSAPSADAHEFGLGRRVRGSNTRFCKGLGVPMPPGKPQWLQMPSTEAVKAAFAVIHLESGDELTRVERVAGMVWEGFRHKGAIKRACEANQTPLSSPEQLSTLLRYVRFFTYHWTVLDDVETIDGSQMTVQAFMDGCEAVGYTMSASEAATVYIDLDKADTGFVTFSNFCSFLARRVEEKEAGARHPPAQHPTSLPFRPAKPARTSETSLSDIEAEIAEMIASEKSMAWIGAGGLEANVSSALISSNGASVQRHFNISNGKLRNIGEEVVGTEPQSDVEADAAAEPKPTAQRESAIPKLEPLPGPEHLKPEERTKQQTQLVSQSEQQAEPESQPVLQPVPEPQLESKLAPQSTGAAMRGASAVPEGLPPSENGQRSDTHGQNDNHLTEVAVDGGASPDPLKFESLVPPDLRADLDRATQLEADGKLSEALATYTDCIRRLAPIYKRKYIRNRYNTLSVRNVVSNDICSSTLVCVICCCCCRRRRRRRCCCCCCCCCCDFRAENKQLKPDVERYFKRAFVLRSKLS